MNKITKGKAMNDEFKGYKYEDWKNLERLQLLEERRYNAEAKRPIHLPESAHAPKWLIELSKVVWFAVIIYAVWKVAHLW